MALKIRELGSRLMHWVEGVLSVLHNLLAVVGYAIHPLAAG